MALAFGFLPVLLFLVCLFMLDSFKLVRTFWLVICLGWGMLAALLSYFANQGFANAFDLDFLMLSRYIAPVSEELIKGLIVFFLISRKKAGFMIDAAIYGFAAGTGFALAENSWYYWQLGSGFDVILAIVRGFGTALMHGGTTAIFAILYTEGMQRSTKAWLPILLGFGTAALIHSLFNHFLLNPMLQTMLIVVVLPVCMYMIFLYSTKHLQQWLEVAFSTEVDLLRMIRQGELSGSRAGQYLSSLKSHFSPEVLVDMYCYFSLYLELSIKAKRNLLLREGGFPVMVEPDIKDKLAEFRHLRRKIGKAGEMALMPLVRMKQRELWELNQWE